MTDYTAGIFIINNNNEILLTHATNSAIKYWGIPKGLVDQEKGESHLAAAIREVEEETGIKFTNTDKINYLGQMRYKNGNKTLVAYYVFLDSLDPGDLIVMGKDDMFLPEGMIDSIDPSMLYCKSMVQPKTKDQKPFPEVDAFRWFPLDVAQVILYQPQKAILPELLKVIFSRDAKQQ